MQIPLMERAVVIVALIAPDRPGVKFCCTKAAPEDQSTIPYGR